MTKIYRFVSLLEAYHLLNSARLRCVRMSLMDDQNEGLGRALQIQETFSIGLSLSSSAGFKKHHEHVKYSTYLSSWTLEPDLMAMWLLYSGKKDSIRLRSSTDKLESAVKTYGEKNILFKHIDAPEGTLQLPIFPKVGEVKYVSFEQLSQEVKVKFHKYSLECARLLEAGEFEKPLHTINLNSLQVENLISLDAAEFLKDQSFMHEREFRASISVSLRNNFPANEWRKPENFLFSTSKPTDPSELPHVIEIPVESNFIDAICFDPRAPKHIKNDQLEILLKLMPSLTIEESNAFGYKPDHTEFSLI